MSAPTFDPPRRLTADELFRRHLREMRRYASDIEPALGADSPIVKRIRSCASSNELALDALEKRACCCCCRSKGE